MNDSSFHDQAPVDEEARITAGTLIRILAIVAIIYGAFALEAAAHPDGIAAVWFGAHLLDPRLDNAASAMFFIVAGSFLLLLSPRRRGNARESREHS
jgi:hypothetical protein